MNDRIIIPDEIYVGLQIRPAGNNIKSSDGSDKVALAFITYKNVKGKLQHEETFNRWRDDEIMRFPYNNEPTKDFNIAGFASRWRTQNKFIRVEDSRGFQAEIPVENFIDIIQNCNLEKGIVKDGLVWGWVRGNLRLYVVGSEEHEEGRKNFGAEKLPNISTKDLNIGDRILLANGKEGVYLGGWHIIESGYHGFDKYQDYILFGRPKPKIKSKRDYFLKVGDNIIKYSSLKAKEILSHEELDIDELYEMIKKRAYRNLKKDIARMKAGHEIEQLKLNSFSTNWRFEREKVFDKYGLSSSGYLLKGEDSSDFRNDYNSALGSIVAISDKPIKDTSFIDGLLNK